MRKAKGLREFLTFLLVRFCLSEFRQNAGAEDGHQGELSHLLSVCWNVHEKNCK